VVDQEARTLISLLCNRQTQVGARGHLVGGFVEQRNSLSAHAL
jgi:hypothetical protein